MRIFKIKDRNDFININKLYFISRIIFIFAFIIFSILKGLNNTVLYFDIEHYYNIAIRGYLFDFEYAFFPLLPVVISLFKIIKIPIIGTILLNLILGYLSTIIIYKITKDIYNYDISEVNNIIIFWLFSPITLFTIIPYTEGIFIFLTLLSFYLYKLKKYPILTGIFLGLSVTTRSFGAMLFFAIFIDLMVVTWKERKKNFKENIIYVFKVYVPATLISLIYPVYLYINKGNLFYFMEVQFTEWHRKKSNLFTMLIEDIRLIIEKETLVWLSVLNLTLLFTALFFTIYFFVKSIKNKENDFLVLNLYLLFCFISCFSTMRVDGGTMASCSVYRYLFSLFPLYIYKKNNVLFNVSLKHFAFANIIIVLCFSTKIFLC